MMIRKLLADFNKSISKRVVASRHKYEVPIKLSFETDRNTGRLQNPLESLFITGETKDLSQTGIAFVVSSIRLKENYLVGEGRPPWPRCLALEDREKLHGMAGLMVAGRLGRERLHALRHIQFKSPG